MRSEQEIIGRSAQYKVKLIKRGTDIETKISHMARSDAGLVKKIQPDRLETMRVQVQDAVTKQESDSLIYATLRWALGLTKDIDPLNLELNK